LATYLVVVKDLQSEVAAPLYGLFFVRGRSSSRPRAELPTGSAAAGRSSK
jgi:hypothetical protein